MCRQPATGGVSPCVCVTACAHREKRRWRREERVYVGMQERIRERRDRQAGKRSKVLLVILPLIQSPYTLKELHPLPLLQRWADACVISALGASRGALWGYTDEKEVRGSQRRGARVFSAPGRAHTHRRQHTHSTGHSALFPWQLEWVAICVPCRNGRNTTNCCMRLHR